MKRSLSVTFFLLGVGSVLADSVSPAFLLNTSNLVSRSSSVLFDCDTEQIDQQASAVFSCVSDQLWEQQSSSVFLHDSRTPRYNSERFIADTYSLLLDRDGNGLPDIWEWKYFGTITNTIATNDADGDGENNISEYIAGTNPQDFESIFIIYIDGQAGSVEWPTVLRRAYTLQYTSDLETPFEDIPDLSNVEGTGINLIYPYISPDSNTFFRVKVNLSE
jgi:hypothetical protein